MKKSIRILLAFVVLVMLVVGVSACGEEASGKSEQKSAKEKISDHAEERVPYVPSRDVEFSNYNKAQELYDSPTTIIWCSVMPQASTAPILTVPVAGKLTSSSTTFFQPEEALRADYSGDGYGDEPTGAAVSARSVDGLFHPDPPKYRYGFTPGGQYVDFFELPTFCTTQPLEFQKDSVAVGVNGNLNAATKKAEAALAKGNKAEADAILKGAAGE